MTNEAKGVEDGMGDIRTCGCTGEFGCFICDIRGQRPRATPAMKDEVESATTDGMGEPTVEDIMADLRCELGMANAYIEDLEKLNPDARRKIIAAGFEQKSAAQPSPTLKDEVYAVSSIEECIEELKEIVLDEDYIPDSFTFQPLWEALRENKPSKVLDADDKGETNAEHEVYAMLRELNMPGQLNNETVRILMPYLEDAVKWRKR